MTFFTEVIIQYFLQVTELLLVFVRLQTLVLFFLCFLAFCEFQCHFYDTASFNYVLVLTFIKGIFHFGLEGVKTHQILTFLLSYYFYTSHKFA